MIRVPFPPAIAGIEVELVAYPIPMTIAAGFPTKRAILSSNSWVILKFPPSILGAAVAHPEERIVSATASVTAP